MKNWWKRFNKLIHFPIRDQVLLIQAFLVVCTIQLGLKVLSFHQFRRLYSTVTKTEKNIETPSSLIKREIWAIQTVSGALSAFCLPQALALTCFLRKDKNIKLIVGVRKIQAFEAHAWVEKNGIILLGELPGFEFKPLWIWN